MTVLTPAVTLVLIVSAALRQAVVPRCVRGLGFTGWPVIGSRYPGSCGHPYPVMVVVWSGHWLQQLSLVSATGVALPP
jgi:hypothetical protein